MGLFHGTVLGLLAGLLAVLSFTSMAVAGTVPMNKLATALDDSFYNYVSAHGELHTLLKYDHPAHDGENCEVKSELQKVMNPIFALEEEFGDVDEILLLTALWESIEEAKNSHINLLNLRPADKLAASHHDTWERITTEKTKVMGILMKMIKPAFALAVEACLVEDKDKLSTADDQFKRKDSGPQPAAKVELTLSKMKEEIETAFDIIQNEEENTPPPSSGTESVDDVGPKADSKKNGRGCLATLFAGIRQFWPAKVVETHPSAAIDLKQHPGSVKHGVTTRGNRPPISGDGV
jgi:hypothetical protein